MNNWQQLNAHRFIIQLNGSDELDLINVCDGQNANTNKWLATLHCPHLQNYADTKAIHTDNVNLAKTRALEFAVASLYDLITKTQTIMATFNKILENSKE